MNRNFRNEFLLFLAIFSLSTSLLGQEITTTKNGVKEEIYFDRSNICNNDLVYMIVEKAPEYKGGIKQLESDLNEIISFDKRIKKEYQLKSTINCKGEIFGFQISESEESQEVERIRSAFEELQNWDAGLQGGIPVDCFYTINIKVKKGKIKISR